MDGILVINKPSGPTSFAIVAGVKRLTGEKRVGHGGTLDPLASGVLPIFLGQATRVVEYLQEYPKIYRADIELGIATDTYDASGVVTARRDASQVAISDIEDILPCFLGAIQQAPPAFSALKRDGQPLYKLARQGYAPEVSARPVNIYRLELVSFETPRLTIDVECSKGTYIRSLAHDLGQKLGVGAHLAGLVRTAYGPFNIKDAITLDEIGVAAGRGILESLIKPLDTVLTLFPAVTLTPQQEQDARSGKRLTISDVSHSACGQASLLRLRAYSMEGCLVGLLALDRESSLWQPEKIFH